MKTITIQTTQPKSLEAIMNEQNIQAICANVDGRLRELNYVIEGTHDITFLDLHVDQAMRIYETTLRYMILKVLYEFDPRIQVTFNYSISRSIYMDIKSSYADDIILDMIDNGMKKLIQDKLPITRVTLKKEEVLNLYKEAEMHHKTNIFTYRHDDVSRVYQCGNYMNYLYGYMLPNTSYIHDYRIFKYNNGFILQYPRAEFDASIPPFVDEETYKNTLKNVAKWSKIIEGDTLDKMNDYATSCHSAVSLIQMSESKHSAMLYELAEDISKKYESLKLIAIAGPSSSGKTTFARRLQVELQARGLHPVTVSIDDYYLEPSKVPRQDDGSPDLEHIESLDLVQFNRDLKALIEGREVILPHFDFQTKKRREGKKLQLQDDDVILIEGIHALNERLTSSILREQKYFIYIAPQTQLHIDRETPIRVSDMRLLRRIVRDFVFRDTSAEETISMWASVRRGEFKWIYEHQKHADYVFNSELTYELAVLKKHAIKRLTAIKPTSPHFMKANYLLKFLKYIVDIDDALVPNQSLLREFIGGSVFECSH